MAFSFPSPSPILQSSPTLNLNATPPAQQQQSLFPQSTPFATSQLQSQPLQPHQLQKYLFTTDRSPASYNTKFEDLHPDSQKFLRQIEERILEYKDESQRLEQCGRLYDSAMPSNSFEVEASHVLQELGGISTAMEREKVIVQELMSEVKNILWNTEVAVRSYIMIRPRFLRPNTSSSSESIPASNAFTDTTNSSPVNQLTSPSMVPVYDFYSGFPKRPSPFMQFTVDRFEKYFTECRQWVEEIEQLLLLDSEKNSLSSASSSLQSLPSIMSNVHDFFVHVAAKVESLHQFIESMKKVYLANQRRYGDGNDPFVEADRRETAKQEAAARRIHPTLHLPAVSEQPSTQGAGLCTSTMPLASSAPLQTLGNISPSGGAFSLISTPAPAATTSSFHLSTPATSASASTLFASAAFSPQQTSFGSASTSLFGSSQAPLFGASNSSFTSTPAIGSSNLFATPSLTAGATSSSGASFGAASKSARPKSRTARR